MGNNDIIGYIKMTLGNKAEVGYIPMAVGNEAKRGCYYYNDDR